MTEPLQIIKDMNFMQAMQYAMVKPDGIHCKGCGDPIGSFNDEISLKESHISGLCQTCQDEVFAPEGEDE